MDFTFEQTIDLPRQTLFEFHRNPQHLAVLLRDWPSFRLLHHSGSIDVGAETWVEETIYKCIPVVMGFRHTMYEPPARFGEELIHGPFRRFTHIHEFEAQGDTRTIVRDRLACELDWPYGGGLVTRTFAARHIRRAFAHRHASLQRLVEEGIVERFAQQSRSSPELK